jgi:ERCC4-type nuclease
MVAQKIPDPIDKVTLICDYREKEVIEHLKRSGAEVLEKGLDIGDFICSNRVCVERKSHSDFVSSIIDGRIFEQAQNMRDNFEKPVVVIEGSSDRQISENALKGAVASLLLDFGVSLVNTKNPCDTAKTLFWMARREQTDMRGIIKSNTAKKPKDVKRLQEFIVSSIPGISTTIAKRMLSKFGAVERIFHASEKELMEVDGVGEKLAKKIRNVLTITY